MAQAIGVGLVTGTNTVLPQGKGSKPMDIKVGSMPGMVVLWHGMYAYIILSLTCGFPINNSHVPMKVSVEGHACMVVGAKCRIHPGVL